ncbi:MAG: GTPase HflX [Elusimicrobiota bacterium]
MLNTNSPCEIAILIGVQTRDSEVRGEESLSELFQLTRTAGAKVKAKFLQKRDKPHPAYYIGTGKVETIRKYIYANSIDTVIIDGELRPTQERNLEKEFGVKVIDRVRLILDIFAMRASTKVAKLQVELAQMEYFLPRLQNIWTDFSRLGGGIGTRGPGEKKIEIDRRIINDRITTIRKKLKGIKEKRKSREEKRKKSFKNLISLVGYTNSGKSTLMNTLTGSNVGVADKLFATLSTTTRQFRANKYKLLLSDTVGFIRKLPHKVVEAFMATLEEARDADLLYHVIDISAENYRHRLQTVDNVLKDLGADNIPIIRVFNKIDRSSINSTPRLERGDPPSVFISALEDKGIDLLKEITEEQLDKRNTKVTLKIPQKRQDIVNSVYNTAHVSHREYKANNVVLIASMENDLVEKYEKYIEK